jgi:hypothetical protein
MRQIQEATGVIASKVEHNRTHTLQHSGAEGLMPYQLHSLYVKTSNGKFHRSYQSEADKEVSASGVCGFEKAFYSPDFSLLTTYRYAKFLQGRSLS